GLLRPPVSIPPSVLLPGRSHPRHPPIAHPAHLLRALSRHAVLLRLPALLLGPPPHPLLLPLVRPAPAPAPTPSLPVWPRPVRGSAAVPGQPRLRLPHPAALLLRRRVLRRGRTRPQPPPQLRARAPRVLQPARPPYPPLDLGPGPRPPPLALRDAHPHAPPERPAPPACARSLLEQPQTRALLAPPRLLLGAQHGRPPPQPLRHAAREHASLRRLARPHRRLARSAGIPRLSVSCDACPDSAVLATSSRDGLPAR
ncbi:hypothetical protein POSPLADRAFT_1075469, partial [Postia placenta MAD-698-R-SB12]